MIGGPLLPGEILFSDGIYLHRRPDYLATSKSLIMDLLQALIEETRHKAVVLLQPTSPFRSLSELEYVKNKLKQETDENTSFVSFKSAQSMHPARMYKQREDSNFDSLGIYQEFRESRRQDCPPVFIRDGGYYIIGRSLVKNRMQSNLSPGGMIRDFPFTINIDSMEDWVMAEAILPKVIGDPNGDFDYEIYR